MIVDGKQISLEIQQELKALVAGIDVPPALHIFIVGENPVIESFIKYKKIFAKAIGVEFAEHRFDNNTTEQELKKQISEVAKMDQGSPGPLGMVVQLPLPEHIDAQRVLDTVPVEVDVDGLTTNTKYLTPVAGAIKEILEREDITITGKQALVVGKGKLVGEPVSKLLMQLGANVMTADKDTGKDELKSLALESDILVSGAGVPNLITKDMIKNSAILLDAGTSTQAGSLVGDIALECADKASIFAKTPGGIGPMTVAILFKNLILGNNN